MKPCTQCGVPKPITEFFQMGRGQRRGACKACCKKKPTEPVERVTSAGFAFPVSCWKCGGRVHVEAPGRADPFITQTMVGCQACGITFLLTVAITTITRGSLRPDPERPGV